MADEVTERESIEAILSRQSAAWVAGDADAFVEAALDMVSFTNVMGMYSVGIEPFRVQHARIFSTIYKGSRMSQAVERVAFIRPDVAIVDTLATLEGVEHLPPGFAPGEGLPKSRLQQIFLKDAALGGSRHSTTCSSIPPSRVPQRRAEAARRVGRRAP